MLPNIEWLKDEPREVRQAALNVQMRMAGCPDKECRACQTNLREIEALIKAVRNAK